MSNILLVDFNNTVMRNYHAMSSLSHKGVPTGGLFGFLKTLSIHSTKYKIDEVIVCHDRAPYFRQKFFDGYKSDRKKMDKEEFKAINKNKKWIRKALEICGIPQWELVGFEADDLIAYLVKRHRKDNVIVLSNDSDLHQLLSKKTKLHFSTSKGLFGYDEFKDKYPTLKPSDVIELNALVGTHNAVPGIYRVGEATALKWMADREKFAPKFAEHKDLIERNQKLVELPARIVRTPLIPDLQHGRHDERELIKFLVTKDINPTNALLFGLARLGE